MCDDTTEKENNAWLDSHPELTRRQFGQLTATMALTAMLPSQANALDLTGTDVAITTPDGITDAYYVHPAEGRYPAVLMWPDIFGLREAKQKMADRLAASGYSVLVVNPFYRDTKAPIDRTEDFWAMISPMRAKLTQEANFSDARAYVAWLDKQSAVDTTKGIGTLGYCMGGPIVMRTAAAVPERIRAGASFHGGGLATAKNDSPHLLIPTMQASFLIAVAENDDEKEPDTKNILKENFSSAGLSAEIEVYEDAMHGWCPPDSRVYHEAQAERAWARLLALLESSLG